MKLDKKALEASQIAVYDLAVNLVRFFSVAEAEQLAKAAIEAYEAECWQSIDEALRMQVDKKTLNVTDKRVAAILDVNQYHIKEMNKFKARIDAAKKRLGDLKAKHTEWYRKRSAEDDHIALISEMESIAYSASCYLDGAPGAYLKKEETS